MADRVTAERAKRLVARFWYTRRARWLTVAVLVLTTFGLVSSVWSLEFGRRIEGVVTEAGTNRPVRAAIVVVSWVGRQKSSWFPSAGWISGHDPGLSCYHVETATTDEHGRYSIPPWIESGPYGFWIGIKPDHYETYAYKPRYELAKGGAWGASIVVKPFTGTRREQLENLALATGLSCTGAKTESNFRPLMIAAYAEAAGRVTERSELFWLSQMEAAILGFSNAPAVSPPEDYQTSR